MLLVMVCLLMTITGGYRQADQCGSPSHMPRYTQWQWHHNHSPGISISCTLQIELL